jgi:beta-galactosidase
VREAGVEPVLAGLPEGVEAVRRGDLLFLLHHGRDTVTVTVPGAYEDLLTGSTADGRVELGRHGVAVLRSAAP